MNTRSYLRDFIKRRKLTKEKLAEILGVDNTTVTHWLSGVRNMPEPINRILTFFDDYELDIELFYRG